MLEKYYRINQATGVSIHVGTDGETIISFCHVQADGSQLQLGKKVSGLRSLEELRKQLLEKSAIALNLAGRGILYKQIEKIDSIDHTNFNKVVPNANFDDFYIQNFVSGDSSFIALVRRGDVDRWLNQLTTMGFYPLMVSLGPFAVANIADQLNFYDGDFSFDGHIIGRDLAGTWTSCKYESSARAAYPVKLVDEKVDEALVVPYAAAFQLILANQIDPVKPDVPSVDKEHQKKLSALKLKAQGAVILLAFFVLLLTNYGLFSWLGSANSKLDAQAALNDQNTDSLAKMVDMEKRKETRINLLGWDGGINKSVLIDQVASLMPSGVSISEIDVNPVDPVSSRAQKSIAFFKRQMQIAGNSDQIIPVNEWIARIRSRKWVKNITLESYTIDNEHNTGRFLIKIDY